MNDAFASLAVVIIGLIAVGFAGLEVLFQISCVTLLLQSGRARGLPSSAWAVIIIVLPVLGGLLYLSFGRHNSAELRRGLASARLAMPGPPGAGARGPRR